MDDRRHGIDSGPWYWQYTPMTTDRAYSLAELADLAGVTTRTVRYYLSQGLLPAVGQSGPGSKYDDRHLARLHLIRRLQAEHLPLAEIRRRLDALDDDEIRELAGTDAPSAPPDSALDYLRSVLEPPSQSPRRPVVPSLARRLMATLASPQPPPSPPTSSPNASANPAIRQVPRQSGTPRRRRSSAPSGNASSWRPMSNSTSGGR